MPSSYRWGNAVSSGPDPAWAEADNPLAHKDRSFADIGTVGTESTEVVHIVAIETVDTVAAHIAMADTEATDRASGQKLPPLSYYDRNLYKKLSARVAPSGRRDRHA